MMGDALNNDEVLARARIFFANNRTQTKPADATEPTVTSLSHLPIANGNNSRLTSLLSQRSFLYIRTLLVPIVH